MADTLKNEIDSILRKYTNPEESLIALLQDVQNLNGYISEDAVKYIT